MKRQNTDGKMKRFVLIGVLMLSLFGIGFYFSSYSPNISGFAVSNQIPSIPQDLANQIISEIPSEITKEKLVCSNEYKTSATTFSCKASDCGNDKYLRCNSYRSWYGRRYYQEVCEKAYDVKCAENPVCNSGDKEINRTSCAGVPMFKLICGNSYTNSVSSSTYSSKNCGSDKYVNRYITKTSRFARTRFYLTCEKEYLTECSEEPICNSGDREIKKEEC